MADSGPGSPIRAELWIARCWRRLRFGQFLKTAADWLVIYLFALGTAVLLVKLAVPGLWPHTLWLSAGVVPVAAAAWWWSGRERFSRTESIALLDSRLGAGGLLMTLTEAPDEEWQARLPQMDSLWQRSLPRLVPVRFARQVVLPVAFLIGACLIPLRPTEAQAAPRGFAGQQAAAELQELLEELDEAAVLEEEEKEKLKDEIQKLINENQDVPLTHEKWETVDALQERMRMRLDVSSATLSSTMSALSALRELTDGELLEMSADALEKLDKDLLEQLQKLANQGALQNAPAALREQLQRLMKNGQLQLPKDPGDKSELLSELDDFLQGESKKLSDLRSKCKGGKCQSCQPCEAGCACSDPTDAACLCANCKRGQCSGGKCQSGSSPGNGSINRGRGDAELTWGDDSSLENTKFKETILPRGGQDQPVDQVIGVTVSTPDDELAPVGPRSAARGATTATGDETWSSTVRPRHRSVVRKYFDDHDRPASGNSGSGSVPLAPGPKAGAEAEAGK